MGILQDISRIGRQIIIRFSYYGMFLSTLNRKIDNTDACPTAGVSKNGLNTQLSVNEGFWEKLNEGNKMFTLLHELLHICFFHITMRNSFRDKLMFNIAADAEINQYLEDLKDVIPIEGRITLQSCGFDPTKEANKGTRYYYEKLMDKKNAGKLPKEIKVLYDKMSEGKPTVCSHGTWKDFEDLSESEQRVIEEQIKTQMKASWENITKNQGDVPNFLKGILEEMLQPKVSVFDWRRAIRQFTGAYSNEIYTKKLRRKYNKRYEESPGLKIKQKKSLLCGADTSGSVSNEEFIEFMREIDVIRRAGVSVTVCECDAYVDKERGVYPFKGLKDLTGRRVTGGGGTSFDPPIKYLNEKANKYSALIYFTDGYASVPKVKSRRPIMWVISRSGKDPEDMKKEGFPGIIIRIPDDRN